MAGSVVKFNKIHKEVKNKNCKYEKTCDLTKAELYSYDYKVLFSDGETSFGTTMYFSYDTKKVSNLENYIVVQFIKGCTYSSKLVDGEVRNTMSRAREFFGEVIPFRHERWVVDSIDTDPAYNNGVNLRHGPYRWNKKKGSYQRSTEVYYQDEKPKRKAHLYIRDLPSTAFYDSLYDYAENVSFQFKTCMFKTKDVPLVSTPEEIKPEKGLFCMDWNSSFIFDHKKKKFESTKTIAQFCQP